jgi:hypothetical protein
MQENMKGVTRLANAVPCYCSMSATAPAIACFTGANTALWGH